MKRSVKKWITRARGGATIVLRMTNHTHESGTMQLLNPGRLAHVRPANAEEVCGGAGRTLVLEDGGHKYFASESRPRWWIRDAVVLGVKHRLKRRDYERYVLGRPTLRREAA